MPDYSAGLCTCKHTLCSYSGRKGFYLTVSTKQFNTCLFQWYIYASRKGGLEYSCLVSPHSNINFKNLLQDFLRSERTQYLAPDVFNSRPTYPHVNERCFII